MLKEAGATELELASKLDKALGFEELRLATRPEGSDTTPVGSDKDARKLLASMLLINELKPPGLVALSPDTREARFAGADTETGAAVVSLANRELN
ncbi:hypothetical protein K490DRAFT_61994 [Saccharata proteae CBS 121410]|uniref:Uncharacterized protein n=1 Tax=Saccharata proteae CBS 121410 TaxID=1314787 RepID=A0A9P4LXK1_9PEZI|nr:hypothetical protein K490DRAFT_61994 [Saccharata proteae CBS 121410]